MEQAGMSMEAAFKQCLLVVSVGTDQFLEIAKLRALRLLVLQVGKACGQECFGIKIQAQTPDFLISRDDPWVNLLRTTVGCFSAATGGADVITLPTFDSAFGIPNEFGLRLARNTHLALMEESNIHRVIDPAGGSWYVESLTQDIAEKAWKKFQEYELNGGFIQQVVSGAYEEESRISRDNYRSEVVSGQKTLIGVNAFREDLATDLARDPYQIPTQSRINNDLNFRISDIESTSEGV
jgi:methylmalonyl-CoA mutase